MAAMALGKINPVEERSELAGQDNIAELAYALWQQRGCPDGSSEVDWLAAEQQLLSAGSSPIAEL